MALATLKAIPRMILDTLFGLYLLFYGVTLVVTLKPFELLGSKYGTQGVANGYETIGRGSDLLPV